MARIPLTSAAYTARSLIAAAQRCVNCFPEANPQDSPAPLTFYSIPGRTVWSTVPGDGPVRLTFTASTGILFAVRGVTLYRYDGASWVSLASMGSIDGRITAADNGTTAVFVDGTTTAPTVNLTTFAVSAMAGGGWAGADFVFFMNGRLIFNKPDTQQFYWTGLYDTTIDALSSSSAEGSPDTIVSMVVDHQEIWFFGSASLEIFYDSGDPDAPFARMQGAFNEVGCIAPYSVNRLDNTIYWLGRDRNGGNIVFRAANYQPQRVSTFAIENEFAGYARTDDAFSWTYQQKGHTFFVLTFPTAQKTWVFDVASGLWHERDYRLADNSRLRDRANCHAYFQGLNLVGDFENGKIYKLDDAVFTDDGAEIVRIKDFHHMTAAGVRQFFRQFVLDCQVGLGDESGSDPQIWLQWSDDGGNTWSSSLLMSLGKIGEYSKRVQWNRLGMGRDRIFRVGTSANAKVAFQGAFIEAAAGTS